MQKYLEINTEHGTMRGFIHLPETKRYPLVIILHGLTGHKCGCHFMYSRLSRQLEKANIASIRMDFLGSGDSDCEFDEMTFFDEVHQAKRILEYALQLEGVDQIYLLGHSMGGAISSYLASSYPDIIQRCVLWAPAFYLPEVAKQVDQAFQPLANGNYEFGGLQVSHRFVEDMKSYDLYSSLGNYTNPLLIIQGNADTMVPYETVKKALSYYQQEVTYIELNQCDHNFSHVDLSETVLKESFHFFVK